MKDNYSWLEDCFDNLLDWYGMPKDYLKKPSQEQAYTEAKQTIISQIEIDKLRARIDEMEELHKFIVYTPKYAIPELFNYLEKRIADLTEKLKELEKGMGV